MKDRTAVTKVEGGGGSPQRTLLRWLLRAIGPVLLILVLLRVPEPERLLDLAGAALGWKLVAAMLLNLAMLAFKVQRWRVLLAASGVGYSFANAWTAFNAAAYIGLLTPGRVGDVLRVKYLVRDAGVSNADGLASVVSDRIWDVYVLLAFVAFGVARFSAELAGDLASLTWAAMVLMALLPLLLLVPGISDRALDALWKRVGSRLGEPSAMQRFLHSLRVQLKRGFVVALPLTLVSFGVVYLQGWLVALAMGIDLAFIDVVALLALASLLALLPVSVSGVGVRELLFAVIFPVLGFEAEVGVSFGLMIFVVVFIPILIYGFIVWQLHPLPLGDASRL